MLEKRLEKHIDLLIDRYPVLEICKEDIISGYELLEECYKWRKAIDCWKWGLGSRCGAYCWRIDETI